MSFYSRDKFAKRLKFIPYILYGKTQIENEDLYQITTVNVSESSVTKHFHATLLAVGIGGWRSAFDTVLQKEEKQEPERVLTGTPTMGRPQIKTNNPRQ